MKGGRTAINKYIETLNLLFHYSYLIFLSLGLLIILIALKSTKTERVKNKDSKLKKTLNFIGKSLYKILKPRNSRKIKKLNNQLKYLPKKLEVYDFYKFKFIGAMLFLVLSLLIYFTNLHYYKLEIIPSSKMVNKVDLFNLEEVNYLQKQTTEEFREKEFRYYNTLKSSYDKFEQIENATKLEKNIMIKEMKDILMNKFPNEEYHSSNAKRMYNKIYLIQNYDFSLLWYIWILIGYMIPNLIVFIIIKYRKAKFAYDVPNIKLATYLLGTMDTTIKELLISLQKVSATYKEVFVECVNNYSSSTLTREDSIMFMTHRVDNVHFRKLCAILKEGIRSSKENAIAILEEDIIMEDKEDMMTKEDKIEKRTWVAIILIACCMLCMILLLLMPFVGMFTQIKF